MLMMVVHAMLLEQMSMLNSTRWTLRLQQLIARMFLHFGALTMLIVGFAHFHPFGFQLICIWLFAAEWPSFGRVLRSADGEVENVVSELRFLRVIACRLCLKSWSFALRGIVSFICSFLTN